MRVFHTDYTQVARDDTVGQHERRASGCTANRPCVFVCVCVCVCVYVCVIMPTWRWLVSEAALRSVDTEAQLVHVTLLNLLCPYNTHTHTHS